VDGTNALQHVPTLLEPYPAPPHPVAAGPSSARVPAVHWLPLCRQVQSAGKCFQTHVRYEDARDSLTHRPARRALIVTRAPSVEAADALLRDAERWTAGSASCN